MMHMRANASLRRRGGAAIEFALILPVLLVLIFGVVEYAWLFFEQTNLVSAVREGARYGVTLDQTGSPSPTSGAQSRTSTVLTGTYNMSGATITATQSGASPSEVLNVTASFPYTPLIGLVPTPSTLNASMTMLLEIQD
jgi:Flp pilus assembly protein TadG